MRRERGMSVINPPPATLLSLQPNTVPGIARSIPSFRGRQQTAKCPGHRPADQFRVHSLHTGPRWQRLIVPVHFHEYGFQMFRKEKCVDENQMSKNSVRIHTSCLHGAILTQSCDDTGLSTTGCEYSIVVLPLLGWKQKIFDLRNTIVIEFKVMILRDFFFFFLSKESWDSLKPPQPWMTRG